MSSVPAQRQRMRRTGRFEYRVMFTGDADADQVDASLNDGVLTMGIPKAEQPEPRQLEIRSAD